MKYIVDIDNIMVKDYLTLKGFSRKFRKRARIDDIIYVNGKLVKNYYLLKLNDELELKIEETLNEDFQINDAVLDVVYEDEWILVVNKPNNLSSQPSVRHQKDNLISVIKNYYLKNNIKSNIHLVNRLDYNTTGLVIVAKTGLIHYQMSKINIIKKYLCMVKGHLENKEGIIDEPIDRYPAPEIKRFVGPNGKKAITMYKLIKSLENNDIIEVTLLTGRTHQIRVHMAYINHPIIDDKLYGDGGDNLKLHCYYLEFIHPVTKDNITIRKDIDW